MNGKNLPLSPPRSSITSWSCLFVPWTFISNENLDGLPFISRPASVNSDGIWDTLSRFESVHGENRPILSDDAMREKKKSR